MPDINAPDLPPADEEDPGRAHAPRPGRSVWIVPSILLILAIAGGSA
jgi:hypothetical protein